MDLYASNPSLQQLTEEAKQTPIAVRKVNGHFHTPYSFSAFEDVQQVMEMAEKESVDVIGINDFYTMAGYAEFAALAARYRKFPLFNIEFMGLLKEEQEAGIRVNDPSNPGRTYFSGKGLDYPVSLKGESLEKLNGVREHSDRQMQEMVEKASAYLNSIDPDLSLDYDDILENHTSGMVRERHIARIIRLKIFAKYKGETARNEVLSVLYGSKNPGADVNDPAAVEGEIRSNLLKSGGIAFVKEDPKAFLDIPEVIRIILDAGGIPCYPVLLDDKNGNYTEFEANKEVLYDKLTALNVYSLELIPGRNRSEHLRTFVEYFHKRGFVITFGTEHNTPALDPLTVSTADAPLDDYLMQVSYEGACIIAAHQFRRSRGEMGFVNAKGEVAADRNAFIQLGNVLIEKFISQ
jgi:hypothetical protein